jgi:hypothetical protein
MRGGISEQGMLACEALLLADLRLAERMIERRDQLRALTVQ